MVKEIKDLKEGIVGFEASDVVTKEDYTQKVIPTIEKALKKHEKVSVLYVLNENFDHYAWQAILEDTKVGIMHPLGWDKIAIVTDVEWMINAVKFLSPLIPFKIKTYPTTQLNEAKQWLEEEVHHLCITLDEKKQVLILEPTAVLTKNDFVYLSTIVDPYLSKGNTLKGLMIKTKTFPGWDSFSAMKEHFTFIKTHHKHIEKLAFVTDSSLIDIFKTISGTFVNPEIKEFDYAASDEALKWLIS